MLDCINGLKNKPIMHGPSDPSSHCAPEPDPLYTERLSKNLFLMLCGTGDHLNIFAQGSCTACYSLPFQLKIV